MLYCVELLFALKVAGDPNREIPQPGPKIPQRNPVVFIQQKAMESISIMHKIQYYHTNMIGTIIKQYFRKRKFNGLTLGVQNSLFFLPRSDPKLCSYI